MWVFRNLENTQDSQNFELTFQVQENGGSEGVLLMFFNLFIFLFIDVIVNKY